MISSLTLTTLTKPVWLCHLLANNQVMLYIMLMLIVKVPFLLAMKMTDVNTEHFLLNWC